MKTGTAQFKALYSQEIVDYTTKPQITNTDSKVIEYSCCRFTPKELFGYYKSGRILMYQSNILEVDINGVPNEFEEKFVARYFDKRSYNIFVIYVDENKLIKKYLDCQVSGIIEISDNLNIDKSLYEPSELLKYEFEGKTLRYNKYILHTDRYKSDNDNYYGHYFNDKNIPYVLIIDSNKSIKTRNESFIDISTEISSDGKSNYSPLELFALSDSKIFIYNSNIVSIDKSLSNSNIFVGFYIDELTMSVYRVIVDSNKNIKHSTYKKIIRQIEIINEDGTYDDFTIDGAIDNIDYYIKDVKNLTFVWDTARHFETWVTIDAENNTCNLIFPEDTKWIREEILTEIESDHIRELSIKDGVIVSAPVGEEWLDF